METETLFGGLQKSLQMVTAAMILEHFGHLIQRTDSFAKTLTLGKIEGRRRRG